MCGLVGMAGNINSGNFKVFRDILIYDTTRGFDSTGVYKLGLGRDKEGIIEKEVGPPSLLWDWSIKSEIFNMKGGMTGSCPKILLGHNRAATVGVVNHANAHPFRFDDIVGAHNGTLSDDGDSFYKDKDLIDSQKLIKSISEKGIEHTWKNMKGAAALSYYNTKAETLHLVRNSLRPLYICWSEKEDVLFWASEWLFIHTAARINKINLKKNKDTNALLYHELVPHELYTFEVSATGVEQKEGKKLSPFVYPTNTNQNMRNGLTSSGDNKNWSVGNKKPEGVIKNKSFNNSDWSKDTLKGNKNTSNLEFTLFACGSKNKGKDKGFDYFMLGRIITEGKYKGHEIKVYPMNINESKSLENYVRTSMIFKTKTRARIHKSGNKVLFLCTSASRVEKQNKYDGHKNIPVNTEEKPPKSNVISLFPDPFNSMVSLEEWEKCAEKVNWCCNTCGNPFDKDDAADIYWMGDSCAVCKHCQTDPHVLAYMSGALN